MPVCFNGEESEAQVGNLQTRLLERLGRAIINVACLSTALLLLATVIQPCFSQNSVQPVESDNSAGALKVLFIGNSFTFANDMPRIFASMMKAGPDGSKPLKIYSACFPSYTLREHLSDNRTLGALEREGPWDYVVLQERSYFPITEPGLMEEACVELDRKIKSIGAKTVLLETWADRNAPTYQLQINSCFRRIASRIKAPVINAGEYWQDGMRMTNLFAEDGHHPSAAGSFLVAACVYRTLTGRAPRAVSAEPENSLGLAAGTARQLKDLASGQPSNTCRPTSAGSPSAGLSRPAAAAPGIARSSGNSTNHGVSTYKW